MRLQKASILKFGTVENVILEFDPGINIVIGPNGSGKTLITTAIQRLMMGRENIPRKQQFPVGTVQIIENNEVIDLSGDQTINEFSDICKTDLENIFFVIDGSSEIKDGKTFYEDIIPRLIGLKISEIESVMEILLKLGRMSSLGRLSGSKDFDRASKQLKTANQLKTKINSFLESDDVKTGRGVLFEISQWKKEKSEIDEKIRTQEEARKVEKIKRIESLLKSAEETQEKIISTEKPEIETIKVDIKDFYSEPSKIDDLNKLLRNWRYYSILFIIATIFPIIPILFRTDLIILGLISLLGVSGLLLCLYYSIGISKRISQKKVSKNRILAAARYLNWSSEDIESIQLTIDKYDQNLKSLKDQYQQHLGALKTLEILPNVIPESIDYKKHWDFVINEKMKVNMKLTLEYSESKLEEYYISKTEIQERIEKFIRQGEEFNERMMEIINRCINSKLELEKLIGKTFYWDSRNLASLEGYLSYLDELITVINRDKEVSSEAYKIFKVIFEKTL